MSQIQRFEINTVGRDFAVGDIHGHFTRLVHALADVRFDESADRLFSVGDLVDRGPESDQVDTWLAKPWFHAVRGNHEQLLVDAYRFDPGGDIRDSHMENGGAWVYGRSTAEWTHYVDLLANLPLIIEVDTAEGLVGIVHADCPFPSWITLRDRANGDMPGLRKVEAACQWSRHRIANEISCGVGDIRAVVVGHSALRRPAVLGNVYHIDTAGWATGYFTLIELATLACTPPLKQKLSWDSEDRS